MSDDFDFSAEMRETLLRRVNERLNELSNASPDQYNEDMAIVFTALKYLLLEGKEEEDAGEK